MPVLVNLRLLLVGALHDRAQVCNTVIDWNAQHEHPCCIA